MKIITKLSIVALFVCLLSVAAFSQAKSIKTVAEDAVFHSDEDGFNISLPADMVQKQAKKEAGRDGHGYLWDFSDAAVVVAVEKRAKLVKTDADVAEMIATFKAGPLKGDKILSETPAKIGEYHGAAFVTEKDGEKVICIVLGWDKFNVTIIGSTPSKSPDIQKLVLEAVQSFEFVH